MKCRACLFWQIRPEDLYCALCGAPTAEVRFRNGSGYVAIPDQVFGQTRDAERGKQRKKKRDKKKKEEVPSSDEVLNRTEGGAVPQASSWDFQVLIANEGAVPVTVKGFRPPPFCPVDIQMKEEPQAPLLPGDDAEIHFVAVVTAPIETDQYEFQLDIGLNCPDATLDPLVLYRPSEPEYALSTNVDQLRQISLSRPDALIITIENRGGQPLHVSVSNLPQWIEPPEPEGGSVWVGVRKSADLTFRYDVTGLNADDTFVAELGVSIKSPEDRLVKVEPVHVESQVLRPPRLSLWRTRLDSFETVDQLRMELGTIYVGERRRVTDYHLANLGDELFRLANCFISHSEFLRIPVDARGGPIQPTQLREDGAPASAYPLVVICDVPPDAEPQPLQGKAVLESENGATFEADVAGSIELLPDFDGYVGVDFGTISSCIAYKPVERGPGGLGEPAAVVKGDDGGYVFPSLIYFKDKGDYMFGEMAREYLIADPENIVRAVKRDLDVSRSRMLRGREYTPEDLIALMIRELVALFQRQVLRRPQHLFVTVPSSFSPRHRNIIREAARRVIPRRVDVFDEPTASAMAYIEQNRHQVPGGDEVRHMVVFDFGGGTLDVSVLRISRTLIEILARRGDSRLGGIDFDFAVAADIATHIQKQYPDFDSRIITADRVEFRQRYVNNRPNRRSFYDLRWRFFDTAERIKIELSEPERTETEYSFLSILDQNGQDIKLDGKTVTIRESYTRERFEDQVQTKIVRSLEVLDNALNAAGVRKEEVDIVLLTGQISRIPIIRQTIQEYFPGSPHIPPIEEFDPKTCVSMGATYLAEILESPEGAVRVEGLNCMSCRYGYKKVEGLAGARFVEVIPDKHPYGGEPQFTEFTIPEVGDLNVRILQNMGTNDEASNNPDILTVGDVYLRGPSGSTVRLEWIVHEFGILRIRTEDREEEIRSVGDSFDGIF